MLPPGRARLWITPPSTGLERIATMGTVRVTSLAARVIGSLTVTMTSVLMETSSRMISGKRSNFPSADRRCRTSRRIPGRAAHAQRFSGMDRVRPGHFRDSCRSKDQRHSVRLIGLLCTRCYSRARARSTSCSSSTNRTLQQPTPVCSVALIRTA
jgi:hypothetical protein